MSRLARNFCGLALSLAVAGPASASDSPVGQVANVVMTNGGIALFGVTGPRTGTIPACASGQPTRWAFNATTAAGQAKLANVLTALNGMNSIVITGTATCVSWPDTEEVNTLMVIAP